ncbi:pilus assembly protein TadG-related protein [Microbacterium sp. NPDC090225]|uniref:pilus assembly protein TadG-related protein n=1 Tax=Microbacterium sp. NPDC090225 TaxID=3364207 RepID=UPI003827F7B5
MRRRTSGTEDGSILLLTLGYVLLAFAIVLVCVCATDLYLAQKRLDALADSAAAAAADGFMLVADEDGVRAELDDHDMHEQARGIIDAVESDASLVDAWTPDGVSVRVTVTAPWHPPVFSPFVPDGVALEATATSRTALQ